MLIKDFTFTKNIIFRLTGAATFHNCTFGTNDYHLHIIVKIIKIQGMRILEFMRTKTSPVKTRLQFQIAESILRFTYIFFYGKRNIVRGFYFLKASLHIQYHSKFRFAKVRETMVVEKSLVIGYSIEFL